MDTVDRQARGLLAAGAMLFMLGLLIGFVIPGLTNPRMGVSAHLEGVMNGTFLLAVGLAWPRVTLGSRARALALWMLLYGTFANWLFVTLAAVFGTAAMTPIAAAGHAGTPWQESLVALGLASVGFTMVVGCGLLVRGFLAKSSLVVA